MDISNYEKVFQHFQEKFLELDHEKAAKKLFLEYNDDKIYVPYFNRLYTIDRRTAEISASSDDGDVSCHDRLLILHHLYYYKKDAVNSGSMVAFRNLPECANFEAAYRKSTLEPLSRYFDGKPELLKKRALGIGGRFEAYGDVSFTVSAFPLISLQFIYWEGDDEFPSSVNILFDKNIAQFIHPESIPALAATGAALLMEMD